MLRTTPPPEGMGHDWNDFVFGSKATRVFGFTPDSLYQTTPSRVEAIPYGREVGPPGEGHSSTFSVFGSNLPIKPRAKSL